MQVDVIPRATIPAADDFTPFRDEEIEQSIQRRFEQKVRVHGDRLAIKSDQGEKYTFTAVNRTANRLARQILARRGNSAEPIALLFEHGAAVLVSIIAVLKAGKFYIALDGTNPPDRLKYMLENCGARLIISDRENLPFAHQLSGEEIEVLNFEEIDDSVSDGDLPESLGGDALAMILYTSGSTGRPKGVMHTHRSVLVDARNLTNGWCLTARDRWLLYAPVGFANSVRTIYSSLLNGSAIYPYDVKKNGFGAMAQWLLANEITIVRGVPTSFRDFARTLAETEQFPHIRVLSLGGEPMLRSDLDFFNRHFLPHCILVHALGPTECLTVCWSLVPHGTRIKGAKLPIGFPLPDKDVLLLDENHQEVPDGEVGELAVKSRYISTGYWRDPERTKAVFLPDPAGSDARVYLTGDLGVRAENGSLIHIGRRDFQVKIRGFRVDVSEIEIALKGLPDISDAVVVGRSDQSGDQRLVAYFVSRAQPPVTVTKMRQSLTEVIPDYMIPSAFVCIDSIPQTPNGKTDRQRLPVPPQNRPNLDTPFAAPASIVESTVAAIWCEVLELDQVGANDDFLELGGDSLKATRTISRISKMFSVNLSIRDFLENPTVAQIAEFISTRTPAEKNAASV